MSYPSYPEYQDSGIDWLGMVPAGWQINRLKDGGSLVSGIGFPHDFQGLEGEEYQFYKVGDLESSSDGKYMSGASNTISATTLKILRARSGVDPLWWTSDPLKMIGGQDATKQTPISAGVPATDDRSGSQWANPLGTGPGV